MPPASVNSCFDYAPYYPVNVPDSDRIYRTELGGYNQVIALTQHMINTGIQNFYTWLELNDRLPEPALFEPDPNQKLKDAVFGPPAVLVEASSTDYSSVRLTLHLKSASATIIQLYESSKPGKPARMEVAELKLKDLRFTVPAKVSRIGLDKESDRYKEMEERMKAGDHSIYQLLVDLASAAWGDAVWDFGKWDDDDWVTTTIGGKVQKDKTRPDGWAHDQPRVGGAMGVELQKKLKSFLQLLSREVVTEGMLTMGYDKQFDPVITKPTFEVNSVRFQTYPWTESNNTGVSPSFDGKGRLNYLLYLENVGEYEAPPEADASKSVLTVTDTSGNRRGNWTDGMDPNVDGPTKFGNFVLTSQCFVEGYFLPKLENLNRLMKIQITSRDADVNAGFAQWSTSVRYTAEISKDWNWSNVKTSDPAYAFKRVDWAADPQDDADQTGWHVSWMKMLMPKHAVQWTWSYHEKDASTGGEFYKHVGSVELWIWTRTSTSTRVWLIPGSNKIFFECRTWTKVNYKIDPSIIESNVYKGFTVQSRFCVIFTMKELDTGGLYFDIEKSDVEIEYPYKDTFNPEWYTGIKDLITQAANNVEFIVNGLRTTLNETNTFVMPSSGVYFFKNPIFDHNANLLAELEYKGVGQDGKPPINESGISDPNITKGQPQVFNTHLSFDAKQTFPKK